MLDQSKSGLQTAEPLRSTRLEFLDALRGLAALCVFGSHVLVVTVPVSRNVIFGVFEPGNFGVVLFFLLSGFVIPLSLDQHRSLRDFWIRRVCRLYPLYWFSVALMALCYVVLPPTVRSRLDDPVLTFVYNLTMVQSLLGYDDVNGVYWTLLYELVFYIIVSVLAAVGLMRRSVLFTVALICVAVWFETIAAFVGGIEYPNGVVSYIATMFVGTVLYRYYAGQVSLNLALLVGCLGVLMIMVTKVSVSDGVVYFWRDLHLVTAGVFAYICFGLALHARLPRLPGALLYLGRISYSLYLLHPIVMAAIPKLDHPLLAIILWTAALLVLSSLSYRWVEQPGIAFGRWLTRRPWHRALVPA